MKEMGKGFHLKAQKSLHRITKEAHTDELFDSKLL